MPYQREQNMRVADLAAQVEHGGGISATVAIGGLSLLTALAVLAGAITAGWF